MKAENRRKFLTDNLIIETITPGVNVDIYHYKHRPTGAEQLRNRKMPIRELKAWVADLTRRPSD